MDKFFFEAMHHVGLSPIIIDENTEFPQMTENEVKPREPNGEDEPKVDVLSKATYEAKRAYSCCNCGREILPPVHYVRIVVKPQNGEVQTQRWCLPCWLD